MFKFLLLFILFGFTSAQSVPFGPGESLPAGEYQLFRILDGDTLTVFDLGGLERSVRFIGIDTPELQPLQPFAKDALWFTTTLLVGGRVRVEPGLEPTDRFGRALAYVFLLDGRDLALSVAQAGLGKVMTLQPNSERSALYRAAVAGAMDARKGLWANAPARLDDRNCGDFSTQPEAQAFFKGAMTPERRDAHRLDTDADGVACAALPRLETK